MEVTPTPQESSAAKLDIRDLPEAIRNWRVGESLQAVARSASENGKVLLQVGNLTLQAETSKPVQEGQVLRLLIEAVGQKPLLRVVEAIQASDPQGVALRNLLPLQRPLAELLANLAVLTRDKVAEQLLTQLPTTPATNREAVNPTQPPALTRQDGRPTVTPELLANLVERSAGISRPPTTPVSTLLSVPPLDREALQSVIEAARQLIRNIPEAQGLTQPGAMERAIGNSGHFLEAHLRAALQQGTPLESGRDLKAGLIQLLTLLQRITAGAKAADPAATPSLPPFDTPLPGAHPQPQPRFAPSLPLHDNLRLLAELLRQTEGSLARIKLHQLGSLPKSESEQRPGWLLELPLRNGEQLDLLQLRIEEEDPQRRREGEPREWAITLAFDLDGLGPLHTRVSYRGGLISSTFWAEEAETAELFKRNMPQLEQQLRRAGLTISKLETHLGTPPYRIGRGNRTQLVDEKA